MTTIKSRGIRREREHSKAADWSAAEWTIQELLQRKDIIDPDPLGQRLPVEFKLAGKQHPSKYQSIIDELLYGSGDISEFKFHYDGPGALAAPDQGESSLSAVVELKQTESGTVEKLSFWDNAVENLKDRKARGLDDSRDRIMLEVIDASNRTRAILKFKNDEFPLWGTNTYFSDLLPATREHFLKTRLRIVIYKNLSPAEKGKLFRSTNTVTPVNHAEMLNSYGDMPIANMIRNLSRTVLGACNLPHALFECHMKDSKNGEEEVLRYKHVEFDNKRLKIDEAVGRIAFRCFKGETLGTSSNEELEAFYEDTSLGEKQCAELQKKVEKCLDFIRDVSINKRMFKKKNVTFKEFTMLSRLYFYWLQTKGEYKITRWDEFTRQFILAMNAFYHKTPSKYAKEIVYNKADDGGRLRHEAFGGYLGDHKTSFKINDTVDWFLHEFDENKAGGITFIADLDKQRQLDTRRCFSRADIDAMLAKQGWKCAIDGLKLDAEDAVGGHIIAHSKGGQTTMNNLIAIHRCHNIAMKTMTADEYRASKEYRARYIPPESSKKPRKQKAA